MRLTIPGKGGTVNAVGSVRLHNDRRGEGIAKFRRHVAEHAGREGADSRLKEKMRRRLKLFGAPLGQRLHGKRGIALDDPCRDVLIAVPRRVLHHDPAVFASHLPREAHRVVVIEIRDAGFRAVAADILQPRRIGPLGHVDDGLLAELLRRPRYRPAVVAVRGGYEGNGPEPLAHGGGTEIGGRQIVNGFSEPFRKVTAHRIGSAKHLEGIEPETFRFVLGPDVPEAERGGQIRQRDERRGRVLRETGMETPGAPGLGGIQYIQGSA